MSTAIVQAASVAVGEALPLVARAAVANPVLLPYILVAAGTAGAISLGMGLTLTILSYRKD